MSPNRKHPQKCGTCQHLRVEPGKDGVVRPYHDSIYACLAPVPDPILPDSIKESYGFRWPPNRRHMQPGDGVNCKTYTLAERHLRDKP